MRLTLSVILLLLTQVAGAQSTQLRADKSKSYIKYFAKHAVHAWTGISKDVSCVVQLGPKGEVEKVAATSKLKSFDSDNSNRDSHMLEVTDALTYPNINFYSTYINRKDGEYTVRGVLAFHGVEKNVEFKMKEETNGKERTFKGEFIFLLEDFSIERPTLFLVKTDNEVKVELFMVF